jgi:hypothetical protein
MFSYTIYTLAIHYPVSINYKYQIPKEKSQIPKEKSQIPKEKFQIPKEKSQIINSKKEGTK